MSVIFAAVGITSSLSKTINFRNNYEDSVEEGFCLMNWIDLALSGAAILCQLFVMECNGVTGYILCFAFLWFSVAIILGAQEHQSKVYQMVQDTVSRSSPYTDSAVIIRNQRLV